MASKIELYSLATPNGVKVSIALEEMGIEYNPHTVNISKNEQFAPEVSAISPSSRIPVITDPNGPDGKPINIFESGAILLYLAEKSGKFLSPDPRLKWETIQWLFFQMAGVGPMFAQFGHFYKFGKDKCDHPYPLQRYSTEVKRLLGVLEERLEGQQFLVGNEYSIADMATAPWIRGLDTPYGATEYLGLSNYPRVLAWKDRCLTRPATARGLTVCSS
jgi:GST-like protein